MDQETPRYVEGIGRRKTSVARVRLFPVGSLGGGSGAMTFLVNQRPWEQYFPVLADQMPIRRPFENTGSWEKFDVSVRVTGGGVHAQADAVRLGVARALARQQEEFRKSLRAHGLLTRDPREKERKKPGLKRARRAPQWQKR